MGGEESGGVDGGAKDEMKEALSKRSNFRSAVALIERHTGCGSP